jgi:hypothetical protein
MALMLYGCAKTLSGVQVPGATTARPGQIRLSWERPTAKADGTPLAEIAGYKMYYGPTSQAYDFIKTIGNHTTYTLAGLEAGRMCYLTVTAYDASGNESSFSNEVRVVVPAVVSDMPVLMQDPLRRGRDTQFRVVGGRPDEVVSFLYSVAGEGDGPCSPQLGGLCIDLLNPSVFGEATADASGTARLSRTIPADSPVEHTISFQAVIRRGPAGADTVKTNAITAKVRGAP